MVKGSCKNQTGEEAKIRVEEFINNNESSEKYNKFLKTLPKEEQSYFKIHHIQNLCIVKLLL